MRRHERRGDPLSALDTAERGLVHYPDNLTLRHRAVLALARSGATDEAERRYLGYEMQLSQDEDVAALGARIAKDRALTLDGQAAPGAAAQAAQQYARVYESSGGYYPAINAATMWLIAGRDAQARALATQTLELVADASPDDYYALATRAEALLLLGRIDETRAALVAARAARGDDHAAMATTRRQLRLICRRQGIDESVLDPLAGPLIAFFCGHIIAAPAADGRFLAAQENAVRAEVLAVVRRQGVAFAYGALAAGADILWAEALLGAGAQLHVVLPFALEEFVAMSVTPSGAGWERRFRACLEAAQEVVYATDGGYLSDDTLFRYGSELAMGLALTRARHLESDAVQLAVWDGQPARGDAGTAVDIARWRKHDRKPTIIVPLRAWQTITAVHAPQATPVRRGRVVRAMLFGDIKGFSRLTDDQLPTFAEHILGLFARVITAYGDLIEHANTWGDALYLVIHDPTTAAHCAFALQHDMHHLDLAALQLPPGLGLRLAGHVGPVFPITDPVLGRPAFMGSHVSRTARIEPITPPGETYVTDAFAAALALNGPPQLACDYVGHLPTAKEFGRLACTASDNPRLIRDRARPPPSEDG